jgi:hypothetical protein
MHILRNFFYCPQEQCHLAGSALSSSPRSDRETSSSVSIVDTPLANAVTPIDRMMESLPKMRVPKGCRG